MSQLVKSACTLKFEEHEFVEFFGVVAPLEEDACSYTYKLHRDGLRLEFTIFPLDGGAYTSIYRDGIPEPVFRSQMHGCTHSRFVSRGRRCLEIGRPERPTSEPAAPLAWGLRLFVEPHFTVEYIHEVGTQHSADGSQSSRSAPIPTPSAAGSHR
jgi:hypothetical protein